MRKLMLLLLLLFATFTAIKAQDIKVTGRITDAATGLPVVSASIKVKGSKSGVSADANGQYTIRATKGAVIIVTSIGYLPKEVTVRDESLSISLTTSDNTLTDVVVVGYGTQKKANLTGSVVTLKMMYLPEGRLQVPVIYYRGLHRVLQYSSNRESLVQMVQVLLSGVIVPFRVAVLH